MKKFQITFPNPTLTRPKPRIAWALALLLLCLCGVLIGCDNRSSARIEEQLRLLESDISSLKQLRHEISSVQADIAQIRAKLTAEDQTTKPLTPKTWKPDGSHRDDPFLGNKDAPVTVLAFGDFECRTCKEFVQNSLPRLKEDFLSSGNVQLIFRDFPLSSHPHAVRAASLAHCAGEIGKYWEMFDLLFANQEKVAAGELDELRLKLVGTDAERLKECYTGTRYHREIAGDIAEAKALGVAGIPAFFVGRLKSDGSYEGTLIRGAQPYPVIRAVLSQLLSETRTASSSDRDSKEVGEDS